MNRIRRINTLIVGGLVTAAVPGSAQEGPSILTLLDTEDRRLEVGGEFAGVLTALDVQATGGRRVQAWALPLSRSQSITVDLRSDVFDAYLYVAGPGLSGALEDDDGAGGCDARITFQASAGVYRVVVSSLLNTGAYTLHVSSTPGLVEPEDCQGSGMGVDLEDLPVGGRRLMVGGEERGMLAPTDTVDASGSHVQAWGLQLEAGQQAAVDLVSDDFDAYLYVAGPGLETPLSDDDGAGGCHARVFFSARESGEYRVVVSTLGSESTGAFTLRVTDSPGPVANEPCGGGAEDFSGLPFDGRALDREAPVTGRLSASDRTSQSGSRIQAWALDAQAGETLTVTLRSDEFDAFLHLFGPQLVPLSDDDGAGGCDARITFTASSDGTYGVVVTTAFTSNTGSFVLEVSDRPSPPSADPCM